MLDLARRRELLKTENLPLSKYDCYKESRRVFYLFQKNVFSKIDNFKEYSKQEKEMKKIIKMKLADLSDADIIDCEKMRVSEQRKKRLAKKRIQNIIECVDYPYKLFLTFTFSDSILASTTQDTRHRYVRRWLSQNCIDYVANIDFGSNDREHYHAVIGSFSQCDLSAWLDKCGIIQFEKIKIVENSCKKMATYINKLTNHTNKNLNRLYRLIYARKRKYKTVIDAFDGSCSVSLIYTKNEALTMYELA